MRNLFFAILTSIALLCGSSVTFTGCSTSSQLTSAQSILTVQTAVGNLMQSYTLAVQAGEVSLEDRIAVRKAYRKYEQVENTVISGMAFADLSLEMAPTELSESAFDLTVFILNIIDK